jgi:hypothetical protein
MNTLLAILCSLLGADNYHIRNAAHETLTALGPVASAHLQLASRSMDPEVRHRALTITADIRRRQVDTWLDAQAELPWFDSAPGVWPVTDEWIHCLHAGTAEVNRRGLLLGTPNWLEYRLATRTYLQERMADGAMGFDEAGALLGVMRKRCAHWVANNAYPQP